MKHNDVLSHVVMSLGRNGQLSIISLHHRQNLTLVKSVCKTVPKSLFRAPTGIHDKDLSACHDWPVKEAMVNLPIKTNGNLKHTTGSLSPLGAESRDIHTASQMLLTEVYVHLRHTILSK